VIESTVDSGSSFIVTFPCTVVGNSSSAGSSVTSTRTTAAAANCSSINSNNRSKIQTTAVASHSQSASAAVTATAGSSNSGHSNQDNFRATVIASCNDMQSGANVHACNNANSECALGVQDSLATAVQLPSLPTVHLRVS
jgi:hypothetical protein